MRKGTPDEPHQKGNITPAQPMIGSRDLSGAISREEFGLVEPEETAIQDSDCLFLFRANFQPRPVWGGSDRSFSRIEHDGKLPEQSIPIPAFREDVKDLPDITRT